MTLPQARPGVAEVGPFVVHDLDRAALVNMLVSQARSASERPVLAYALHVGGLNARHDLEFVAAMRAADVVYADGGSAVLLARLAGAAQVERAPTTDIGWDILRKLAEAWGRPVRVALVGGPRGLAERAGRVLADGLRVEVVQAAHGYHEDWSSVLAALRSARPDVTVVGMGAPREMVWCQRHREQLPPGLVLTSGGWFGHLVGDERRAPRLLRRSGLEWIARLGQSPRRLAPRYARGLLSTAAVALPTLRRRSSSSRLEPDS